MSSRKVLKPITVIEVLEQFLNRQGHAFRDDDDNTLVAPGCGWNQPTITDAVDDYKIRCRYPDLDLDVEASDPDLFYKIEKWAKKVTKAVERDNATVKKRGR